MMKVTGVGENKYEWYGERFLKVIFEFSGGEREKYYFGETDPVQPRSEYVQQGTARAKKADFYLTKDQAERFPYAERYLAAEFAEQLNELRDEQTTKKTSGAELFRRMQAEEYAGEKRINGIWKKYVTNKGQEAGLFIGMRSSRTGKEYEDIYYGEKAQRMIVEHMIKM